MGYPTLYREIKAMIRDTALETQVARAIVRKSGIRQATGQGGEPFEPAYARTLVDCYLDTHFGPRHWQWNVNLSGFSRIRLVSRGGLEQIRLFYSLAGATSTALDPGDYEGFTTLVPDPYGYPTPQIEAYSGNSELDGGNPWAEIPESLRTAMRLSISTATLEQGYLDILDVEGGLGGVSVAIEVM